MEILVFAPNLKLSGMRLSANVSALQDYSALSVKLVPYLENGMILVTLANAQPQKLSGTTKLINVNVQKDFSDKSANHAQNQEYGTSDRQNVYVVV